MTDGLWNPDAAEIKAAKMQLAELSRRHKSLNSIDDEGHPGLYLLRLPDVEDQWGLTQAVTQILKTANASPQLVGIRVGEYDVKDKHVVRIIDDDDWQRLVRAAVFFNEAAGRSMEAADGVDTQAVDTYQHEVMDGENEARLADHDLQEVRKTANARTIKAGVVAGIVAFVVTGAGVPVLLAAAVVAVAVKFGQKSVDYPTQVLEWQRDVGVSKMQYGKTVVNTLQSDARSAARVEDVAREMFVERLESIPGAHVSPSVDQFAWAAANLNSQQQDAQRKLAEQYGPIADYIIRQIEVFGGADDLDSNEVALELAYDSSAVNKYVERGLLPNLAVSLEARLAQINEQTKVELERASAGPNLGNGPFFP